MSSLKRKRMETNDSDEESPSYGRQILPVANLPDDFDGEPADGLQYLFMVRRDARMLPGTVRVPNPYEAAPSIPQKPPMEMLSESHSPSVEWREAFEYRFKNFRKNFNQPTIHVGTPAAARLMPDKGDRDMWWSYLSGKPESEWNRSKKSQRAARLQQPRAPLTESQVQSVDDKDLPDTFPSTESQQDARHGELESVGSIDPADTLPSPEGTPVPLDYLEALAQPSETSIGSVPETLDENYNPREPTPEVLKTIDERTALHLLMYFTHWINLHLRTVPNSRYTPTESHARWMFALLSRIDDFISPDDLHLLRNLGRACLGLLHHVKTENLQPPSSPQPTIKIMNEASCWIILATITGIWKQRDLWADAESILRKNSPKYLQV
ncbi:hypothetical protein D9613_005107 [Agrocybe pediades]|uniref:Uncharacterized protein n=1 Tax=Agrocybe pediades TaxID=84607 RepID=A0A8H4QZW5_9AGAR|nr:hypothetical protein D9613_005107 [Agrocybe pediades]